MCKKPILLSLFVMFICCIGSYAFAKTEKRINILATTYPIYNFTKIVTHGEKNIDINLLLSASMGCPHDYAVTPHDLKKIANANVLVVNGLGMEEFLGEQIHRANPKLQLIDSSEGISDILHYMEEDTPKKAEEDHHHQSEAHGHGHEHHEGLNPHLFASPKMAAQLTTTIASKLAQLMPKSEARIKKNAEQFSLRMESLMKDFIKTTSRFKNNRIVTQQGVFDYLARDIGLRIVAVIDSHAGREPSASQMMKLVKTIREKRPGAIITQFQNSSKVDQAIGKETGLPVVALDPVAVGPIAFELDYYELTMKRNIKILEQTLGRK